MSTFAQLQTRVSSNVIDLQTPTQTNVPVYINAVIEAVQSLHNFNCMKAEIQGYLTTNSTSSHLLLNTPQGFKEPRGTPYYLQNTTINRIDWAPNRTYVYRQWNADSASVTGPPALLLLGESVTVNSSGVVTASSAIGAGMPIYVYPFSDGMGTGAGGQYPIYIPYWAILPDLSNASDVNWFTTYMTEFIVAAATAMAFEMEWDEGVGAGQGQVPGGRAGYWRTQAFGPQWNGVDLKSAGGWLKVALELDRRLGYAPIRTGT